MTILSDASIKSAILKKKFGIGKLEKGKVKWFTFSHLKKHNQIGPSSIDLRLANDFRVFKSFSKKFIDTHNRDFEDVTVPVRLKAGEPIVLQKGSFLLGRTAEYIKIPDGLVARLEGRSSYGRLGISVHATAGYIDPGFEGTITLEIENKSGLPVLLWPGKRVCQLVLETLTQPAEVPYNKRKGSKYNKQITTTASRIDREL